MTTDARRAGPFDEPFRDPRPDGPFVELKRMPAPPESDRWLLGQLGSATMVALGQARAAMVLFEHTRQWVDGANSAALAVAALERLVEELQRVEEAYGLELLAHSKRSA